MRRYAVGAWLALPLALAPAVAAQGPVPDTPQLRWEFFYRKRAYPFDRIPADAVARAQAQAMARRSNLLMAPPPIAGSAWTSIGPAAIPINGGSIGRLTTIAVHPTDPGTIYVGGAQGGVWKSTTGGASWMPMTDAECSLAMGWIAIDPVDPDIVYAGTGEQHFSADSYYGCGLLRSVDGGASWTQLGASVFRTNRGGARISRVVLDPATAGTVATTRLYVASDFGLHVSADGGASFTLALPGVVTDLVMDPTDAAVLYAAVRGVGVYKSTDSGVSWLLRSAGFATSTWRINLAIAPSAPDTLYASVQNGGGSDLAGIWRTTDGAATWGQRSATGASCGNQCWYDMTMAVDPGNPDVVYFGGVYLYKSTDGAAAFTNVSGSVHVDQHVLTFAPSDAGQLFVGNDGGIFRTTDGGASWTSLNTDLALTQFYEGIALHPWDPLTVTGGTQDNGTLTFYGNPSWWHVLGGDGGFTAIDHRDPTIRYAETQWQSNSGYSGPRRSDGGAYLLRTQGIDVSDRALFIPPLVMDPVDPATLYFGTYRVYRTTNRAASWVPISPDLTLGVSGSVSAIAPAPSDPSMIYVGTSDGLVQWTDDGGATWTPRPLPTGDPRYVQDIAVDPRDPRTAWVVVSGFLTPHVFRTTDGGATFTNASGSLPDSPVNAVVVDPTSRATVIIGTDVGAYMSVDSGTTWTALTTGMPNVAVFDVAYNANTGTLIAATHGRGMFRLELVRALTLAVVDGVASDTVPVGASGPRADSAVVILSGTDAATTAWSATHTAAAWVTLTNAAGTGTGRVRWTRDPTGLAAGVYVDTITVTAPGAIDSPWLVVDSLVVQAALSVTVAPTGRAASVLQGSTMPIPDSAALLIEGWGADTTQWTATRVSGWLTLLTTAGTGAGTVRWTRNPTALAVGTHVDTIRIATSQGAFADLHDTLAVMALPLVLEPASRRDTADAGSVTLVPDSAAVTLQGPGSDTASWTATHGTRAWVTLTTAGGTGSGTVRWTRDPAGLLPGTYTDTIRISTSRADTALVIDTFVLLAPTVTASCAASDLLAPGCLTDVQRRYLDLTGNADGIYNLGDLVALRKRGGAVSVAERRP